MVSRAKIYVLKLVSKLKSNKSLKLLLVDMKVNSSYEIGDGRDGADKRKCLFIVLIEVRGRINKFSRIS